MSAYVRVRKLDDLVQRIDDTGTQVDVAAAAGLSTQRVSQLYTGNHNIIEVRKARALEEVLGVPHGALFVAVDGPLLLPYVDPDGPEGGPDSGEPDPAYDNSRQPASPSAVSAA